VPIYRAPAGAEAYMDTLSSAESGRAVQMCFSFVPSAVFKQADTDKQGKKLSELDYCVEILRSW